MCAMAEIHYTLANAPVHEDHGPRSCGRCCGEEPRLAACFLFLVCLHPMTQVGSLRMCLDPDVVPPLAGFLLVAVLGVLHHILSVSSVCIFKTAHCFRSFYITRDHVPGFHDSV